MASIKDLFKRIAGMFNNKKRLPPAKEEVQIFSDKEIRKEVINMSELSKKENNFLEELKFNPKDLLDPRVCKGENLVPNILKTLGANENILKNSQIMDRIEYTVRRMCDEMRY